MGFSHGHRPPPAPPWRHALWSNSNSPTHPSFSKPHFERAALPHGGSNTLSAPTAFQSITQEFLAEAVSGISAGCHGNWRNRFSCVSSSLLDIWYLSCWLCNRALSVPRHQLSTAQSSQHDNATRTHARTHTHTHSCSCLCTHLSDRVTFVCCQAAGTVFGNT